MDRSEPLAKSLPLLLLGVAGVTAVTLLAGRGPTVSTATSPRAPAESRQETPTRSPGNLLGARPALEILAEYLGVPSDVGRLERDARWTAEEIRARNDKDTARPVVAAQRLAASFGPTRAQEPDLGDLATLSVQELKDPAGVHRQELLDELARQQETEALLAAVQRRLGLQPALAGEPGCLAAADAPPPDPDPHRPRPVVCPELKVVVATMPDYVDSYGAWTFDRNLDGVQRAASAAGYVLDRFQLPDWDPESSKPKGERHRFEPGVILFRAWDRPREVRRLLLVLTPVETATAGIQKLAFLSAATLARELGAGDPLLVLGPSFSGSSPSLRIAMQEALHSRLVGPADRAILVRSGSATSRSNKRLLERPYCASRERGALCTTRLVDFQATTVSDDDAQNALARFLGTIERDWAIGRGVAILYEANTSFGQGFAPDSKEANTSAGQGSRSNSQCPPTDGGKDEPTEFPFPCAVRLTYPLHISRLRAQARERIPAGRTVSVAGPGTVAFRLDDTAVPQDQLPSVRPESTAAVVQTTLATILDTLERSPVGAVGLFGTDDRDKIFLAEQISYRCPNVQIFTIEGGLAFLHPETRAFLRGAVVAASYPLFSATQVAPGSRIPLHQFQGVAPEGIYNALLSLLGEERSQGRSRLLDYEARDCDGAAPSEVSKDWRCGPGVWISVIGHNAVWPVRRYGLTRKAVEEDYTWRPSGRSQTASAAPAFRLQTVAVRLQDPAVPSSGTVGETSDPAPEPQRDADEEVRGALRWPGSARLVFGLVAVALLVHAIALLALAWSLGLGGRWRSNATVARFGIWLEARLLRHVPWLEPPERCAARWIGNARTPGPGGVPSVTPDLQEARRLAARDEALRQEYWLSLLACGGSLLAVAVWVGRLMAVGLDVAAGGRHPATLAFLLGALGIAFVVAAAAALLPTAARRQAGLGPLIALRALPVLLGCISLYALGRFLHSDALTTRQAVFNALRLADVTSLVSPTLPVLALSAVVYLWGLWNLWRVHEQAVEFGAGASVIAVLRGDQPATADRFSCLLDAPELTIGLPAAAVLGVVVAVQAGAAWGLGFHMHSADGKWMALLLLSGTTLVSFLVCHTLAHGLRQGRTLLGGLQSLSLAPIGRAFAGLGAQPELWQLSAGIPRAREAHVLVQQVRATVRAFDEARGAASPGPQTTPALSVPEPPPERSLAPGARAAGKVRRAATEPEPKLDDPDCSLARQLHVRPGDAVELRWGPASASIPVTDEEERRPLHASSAWREIERWSEHLVRVLSRGPWARRTCPAMTFDQKKEEPAGVVEAHLRAAETLLALQVAFSVRFALVRLMSVFALAVTGLMLLLVAHLFYAFQSRAFWLGVDWVLIGTATAIIVYLLVRLEKSTLLSRLWRSEPGKLNWSDQLVHRILVYGAIPVITLFVAFFPEVGAALFSWLEPVQKSLP
jgi:hypothetical protein